jgi:hypothetical protein
MVQDLIIHRKIIGFITFVIYVLIFITFMVQVLLIHRKITNFYRLLFSFLVDLWVESWAIASFNNWGSEQLAIFGPFHSHTSNPPSGPPHPTSTTSPAADASTPSSHATHPNPCSLPNHFDHSCILWTRYVHGSEFCVGNLSCVLMRNGVSGHGGPSRWW